MATVDVIDSTKKIVGSIDLSDEVFGVSIKEPLVHSAVVCLLYTSDAADE